MDVALILGIVFTSAALYGLYLVERRLR